MLMLKPLTKESIGQEFRPDIFVQDYSSKTKIEGVQLITLQSFVDDGGALVADDRVVDTGLLQVGAHRAKHAPGRDDHRDTRCPGALDGSERA